MCGPSIFSKIKQDLTEIKTLLSDVIEVLKLLSRGSTK